MKERFKCARIYILVFRPDIFFPPGSAQLLFNREHFKLSFAEKGLFASSAREFILLSFPFPFGNPPLAPLPPLLGYGTSIFPPRPQRRGCVLR